MVIISSRCIINHQDWYVGFWVFSCLTKSALKLSFDESSSSCFLFHSSWITYSPHIGPIIITTSSWWKLFPSQDPRTRFGCAGCTLPNGPGGPATFPHSIKGGAHRPQSPHISVFPVRILTFWNLPNLKFTARESSSLLPQYIDT